MLKKAIIGFLILLILAAGGFVAWASQTNPLMPGATAALQSDGQVRVSDGDWLVFEPVGQQPIAGLIFYPGGKVDYRAYAPYARAVAREGFLVVIPRMPLNLAVLDAGAAGKIQDAYPQVQSWAVGGHSLGGSMAANYARQNPEHVRGLALLASYPAESDDLTQADIQVVSIYGSEDGLASQAQVEESRRLLPAGTLFLPITGGNHAQFGDYGEQDGDQPATISREEQQAQAVAATVDLLKRLDRD